MKGIWFEDVFKGACPGRKFKLCSNRWYGAGHGIAGYQDACGHTDVLRANKW